MWVSVEPNINWHYEVLLQLPRSNVLPVDHHEKLCLIVPSSEAGTLLLLKMCCHFMQWNI